MPMSMVMSFLRARVHAMNPIFPVVQRARWLCGRRRMSTTASSRREHVPAPFYAGVHATISLPKLRPSAGRRLRARLRAGSGEPCVPDTASGAGTDLAWKAAVLFREIVVDKAARSRLFRIARGQPVGIAFVHTVVVRDQARRDACERVEQTATPPPSTADASSASMPFGQPPSAEKSGSP